jgi:hypothetical protein
VAQAVDFFPLQDTPLPSVAIERATPKRFTLAPQRLKVSD